MTQPVNVNSIAGVPENTLPVQDTILDNDYLRVVNVAGQSKLITFYNSVKQYVNSIINNAVDKMLKSDGSVSMDTGYTPNLANSLVTKNYVDTNLNNLNDNLTNDIDSVVSALTYSFHHLSFISSVGFNVNNASLTPVSFEVDTIMTQTVLDVDYPTGTFHNLIGNDQYEFRFDFYAIDSATDAVFAIDGINNVNTSTLSTLVFEIRGATFMSFVISGVYDDSVSNPKVMVSSDGTFINIKNLTITIKRLSVSL